VSTVQEGSSIAQGFNPLVDGAAPWISTTPLQSTNSTYLNGAQNALLFEYQVTDLDTSDFAMVPNPFREICIEAQDGGEDPAEGWNRRCYRVFILSGPRFDPGCPYEPLQSPEHPDGQPVFVDYCPKRAMRLRSTVAIGQHFEGNIYFYDPNHDGTQECAGCRNISISLLADPGLPNGATMRETVGGPRDELFPAEHTNLMTVNLGTQSAEPTFKHLFSRRLAFTPLAEQDLTYRVCVDAMAAAVAPGGMDSPSRVCVLLDVVTPSFHVLGAPLAPEEPAPLPLGTQTTPATITSRMRCKESFTLTMFEGKDLDGSITQTADTAGFEPDVYVPTVRFSPDSPPPPGLQLSPLTRVRTCADPFRVPSLEVSTAGLPEGEARLGCPEADRLYHVSQHTVTWQPQKGTEGQSSVLCLDVVDHRLPAHVGAVRRCAELVVAKCEVCVAPGDTLLDVAKEYRTSWLQLWGANPWLRNPHHLPAGAPGMQSVISLGPTVEATRAERLGLLAARYEMTPDMVQFVNPDLDPSAEHVDEGQRLCIVSEVCAVELPAPPGRMM